MLVSRVTLDATILTPGFSDQAGDIGLSVAKPEGLLTPILAELHQLPVRQVSPKGIGRDLIRGFPVRAASFTARSRSSGICRLFRVAMLPYVPRVPQMGQIGGWGCSQHRDRIGPWLSGRSESASIRRFVTAKRAFAARA